MPELSPEVASALAREFPEGVDPHFLDPRIIVDHFTLGSVVDIELLDIPYELISQDLTDDPGLLSSSSYLAQFVALTSMYTQSDRILRFAAGDDAIDVFSRERQPNPTLDDAEAIFLIALKHATPQRPVDEFYRELRSCAALGMKHVFEEGHTSSTEQERSAQQQTIVDATQQGALERLRSSNMVRALTYWFQEFTRLADEVEHIRQRRGGREAFLEALQHLQNAGAVLESNMNQANTALASGIFQDKKHPIEAMQHMEFQFLAPVLPIRSGEKPVWQRCMPKDLEPGQHIGAMMRLAYSDAYLVEQEDKYFEQVMRKHQGER